jgi:hypothetical protein
MMDGLDMVSLDGSLSLSGSSVSDGPRDTGNFPARSERRDTNPGRLARVSEYEAPVNGSHFSKPSSTACPSPRTYLLPHRQRPRHNARAPGITGAARYFLL